MACVFVTTPATEPVYFIHCLLIVVSCYSFFFRLLLGAEVQELTEEADGFVFALVNLDARTIACLTGTQLVQGTAFGIVYAVAHSAPTLAFGHNLCFLLTVLVHGLPLLKKTKYLRFSLLKLMKSAF